MRLDTRIICTNIGGLACAKFVVIRYNICSERSFAKSVKIADRACCICHKYCDGLIVKTEELENCSSWFQRFLLVSPKRICRASCLVASRDFASSSSSRLYGALARLPPT